MGDIMVEKIEIHEKAFPRSTIYSIMREEMQGKTIASSAKRAMNEWLVLMCRRVARKLNSFEYKQIELGMFQDAIKSYEQLEEIELERTRLISQLAAMRDQIDVLMDAVDRKYKK